MTKRLCSVDGCGRPHYSRGFCKAHYKRHRAGADFDPRPLLNHVRNPEIDPRLMSSNARAEFGAIVSFEGDQGQRLTLHREGHIVPAVRAMCAIALARDESYRVVAISTPSTIMGDLDGRMAHSRGGRQVTATNPDATILAKAGYAALLHPKYGGRRWDRKPTPGGAA